MNPNQVNPTHGHVQKYSGKRAANAKGTKLLIVANMLVQPSLGGGCVKYFLLEISALLAELNNIHVFLPEIQALVDTN